MIRRTLKDGRTVTARQNGGIRKRCGCARSKWTDCSHPWHANFSYAGHEHRVSLHKWAKKRTDYVMLQGEAKSLFRAWTTAIENGDDAAAKQAAAEAKQAAETAALTFDAVAKDYLRDFVHHPDRRETAAKEMARQVETLRAVFGAHPMAAITKPMIEMFRLERRQAHQAGKAAIAELAALRAARVEDDKIEIPDDLVKRAQRAMISTKAGRVSTNRLLARLRHLFTWAIVERELIDVSPFTKAGKTVIKLDGAVEEGRGRRLEGNEETRLLKAAGPHLRACIEAALETGMRKGEILGLRWEDVHEDAGIITVPASVAKTGVGRQVIITPRLTAILEMRRSEQRTTREIKDDDEKLPGSLHPFGNELGERVAGFKTAWRLTCKRASIVGLHFHDLRRESGSRLLEVQGVSLTDVRDYLGHRDVSQTNTYLATTTLRLKDAIAKRTAARTNLAQTAETADTPSEAPAVTH